MIASHGDRLFERDAELEQIDRCLSLAREGQGSLLMIEGPAGVGKTALLRSARPMAEAAGMTAIGATASEVELEIPFVVAERLLTALGLEVSSGPSVDGGDLSLMRALERGLLEWTRGEGSDGKPIALLIDDVQWADRGSLRFLLHLALDLGSLPIALILARRTEGELDDLLRALRVDAQASVLCPASLGRSALGELAASMLGGEADAGLAAALEQATGGNPFYATELLRELGTRELAGRPESILGAVPETVLHALLGRLARCGADASALAKAIAILGEDVPPRLVGELAGLEREAVATAADRLVAADILAADPPMRFSHPLIGSTLRSDIGPYERAEGHRRAAALLERAGAAPERIAVHLLHAHPDGDAGVVETLREAGAAARARGEPGTAARFLARALEEPPPEDCRADVLGELAEAEATAGAPGAIEHFHEAMAAIGDPRLRAEACVSLARTLHLRGEFQAAAATADEGLEQLAEDEIRLRERLQAVWLDAAILCAPLHPVLAERTAPLLERLRDGSAPADPALRVHLASTLAVADAPAAEVLELLEGAFEDPLIDGDPRGAALGFAANVLVALDALEPAERLLDRAVEVAERRGAVLALSIARHFRAHVYHHSGRLTEAILDGEHALEVYRFGWAGWAWSKPILTLSELERGDLDRAVELAAVAETADPDHPHQALVLEARCRVRLAQRDSAGALADARAAGAISADRFGVRSSRQFEWVRLAAQAAYADGQVDEAQELAADALARAREGAVARQLGLALMVAGFVNGGNEGIELLREARVALATSPSKMAVAHAELELGAALRRAGRRSEAEEPLRRALELATGFEADPTIARARSELQAIGLRPRSGARSGPDSLTPGERRVCDLAAAGLSTPEIAHDLVVSRRTVENHLYRIYRKLGISSRAELASALAAPDSATVPKAS